MRTSETFYVRDKQGDIWLFSIKTKQTLLGDISVLISGCPMKEYRQNFIYAKIDADICLTKKQCQIIDTIVHPDYRRRHIGSLMMQELVRFLKQAKIEVDNYSGEIAYGDERIKANEQARDAFWHKIGFEVKKPLRKIDAHEDSILPTNTKAHKITERECMLEAENNVLLDEIKSCHENIERLESLLKWEKEMQPPHRKIHSTMKLCLNHIWLLLREKRLKDKR